MIGRQALGVVVRAVAAGLLLALGAGCVPSSQPADPSSSATTPSGPARGPITFATPGDPTGQVEADLHDWNALHPDEPVTLRELPVSSDAQREDFADRAQRRDGGYTVMALDLAWVPQLADAGALAAWPSGGSDGYSPASLAAGTYQGVLYAHPYTADAGLLYYRKDLLDTAGLAPPRTWDELASACAEIVPLQPGLGCFATPDRPGEALVVSVLEAVQGAGGRAFAADGSPSFDSAAAAAGLSWLKTRMPASGGSSSASGHDDGTLRAAFGRGEFLFMRGWGEAWPLIGSEPGAVVRLGDVGVTLLPGRDQQAASVLGGRGLAISAHGGNLDTARDFVSWMAGSDRQLRRFEAAGSGPTLAVLWDDPAVAGSPLGGVLGGAIAQAVPRPAVRDYAQLSKAVFEDVGPWLADESKGADSTSLLAGLQGKLSGVVGRR